MHLILPAAGHSTRFPETRPKWMLTHPNGNMMAVESVRGLNLKNFKSVSMGVLKKHIKLYPCVDALKKQFALLGCKNFKLYIFEKETSNQPETIAKIIKIAKISGPIFCKDIDNYFSCTVRPGNYVALHSLGKTNFINPSNKSYAVIDYNGWIQNIVEKKVISEFFCVGGYGFNSAKQFLEYFESLKKNNNLYVSDIIFKMLLDNTHFKSLMTKNYRDWGTSDDWKRFKRSFATLFIDLDGVLVENSSEFMKPFWGDTKAIKENAKLINQYYDSGRVHVIITTSRGEAWKNATIKQLKREGIKYHRILFGLYHAQRIVINDFAPSNPFPTAISINLNRDMGNLEDYLNIHLMDTES